jgi:V8-like Glu-specific endopeptidase
MMSPLLRGVFLLLASCTGLGCADAPADEDANATSDAIVGGEETAFWPAVGVTVYDGGVGCSGTLVASNVVLLAGHCFPAGRTDIAPWQFQIERNGKKYRYDTGPGWVYSGANGSRDAGEDDIALVSLKTAVPSSVARPLELAREFPAPGTAMQILGYGCTDRAAGGGQGTKRRIRLTWGENADALCPNDSGGALIESASGRIAGVNSGYYTAGSNDDIFAWVPKHEGELRRQIAALRR